MNRPPLSLTRSLSFALFALAACGRDALELAGPAGGNAGSGGTSGGGTSTGPKTDAAGAIPGSGGSNGGAGGGNGGQGGRGNVGGGGGLVGSGGNAAGGTGAAVVLPPQPDVRPSDGPNAFATALVVRPQMAFVPVGTKVQFNAFLQFSPTEFQDVTASVRWTVEPAASNNIQNGVLVADKSGPLTIAAQTTMGLPFRTTVMATAVDARITSLTITPPNPTINVGQRQQLSAIAAYSDGTQRNVTEQATWNHSMTPVVATVSSAPGSRGLVTGLMMGRGTIGASFAGTTGTTGLSVQGASGIPTQIVVTPQGAVRMVGDIIAFDAVAQFPGGATTNITTQAVFTSSNPMVAQALIAGRFRCGAAGTATIAVTYMNVIGRADLRCGDSMMRMVKDLLITPENASLPVGQPLRVLLDAVFTDGTMMRVQFGAVWKSNNDMIATVDGTGVVRAVRMGMTSITVTYGGVTKMVNITVL